MRIEVCGGIASGKTTLATALQELDFDIHHECFAANPFFEKFYSDPARYAFETELVYLLQHFSQLRENAFNSRRIAVDFSLVLDLAYARVTLDPADRGTFSEVFERVVQKIGLPDLIVRLHCRAEVEIQRIHRRARPAEQRIEPAFLHVLDLQIEEVLRDRRFASVPVLRFDSEALDFREEGHDRLRVLERIAAMFEATR